MRNKYVSVLISLVCLWLLTPHTSAQTDSNTFLKAQGKNLVYRGQNVVLKGANFDNINALGANIGSGRVEDISVTEEDYRFLSSLGGNHARFGMSFSWYKNNKQTFFQALDQQLAWARGHNIWVILNLFTTPSNCYEGYSNVCSIWNSPTEQQELQNFWIDVATKYKNEPALAGYDLLNEPNPQGPNYCETWFTLAQKLRNAITAVDSNHLVVIEACSDPSFSRVFTEANSTAKATNVLYEVHDYDPMATTHPGYQNGQAALRYPITASTWVDGVQINLYFDKSTFLGTRDQRYSTAKRYSVQWANTQNVPIYIGEWGMQGYSAAFIQATQDKSQLYLYIRDKAEVYNSLGVSHAYYTWAHDIYGDWRWGIFPRGQTPSRANADQHKLDAFITSLSNAVKPNFSGTPTTPTQNPASTKFSLTVFLHGIGKGGDNVNQQGIGNMNPLHPQRTGSLELYNSDNQLIKTIPVSLTFQPVPGSFTGMGDLGNIASGSYTAKIKIPQYLHKVVPGIITITSGQTKQLSPLYFVTGDHNNDNQLSILDYNLLLDCFSDLTPARNCSDANKKLMTDSTDDGSVNQFDYNLFLRELSVQSGG